MVFLHMIGVPDGSMCGGIRKALVLGLVLIAGTAIEQTPSVCSHNHMYLCAFKLYYRLLV